MWDQQASYHCLALRDVRVAVRVGAFPAEQAAPQTVAVDVELYRHHGPFTGEALADCLDYDRVFRHLTEVWPARPHTALLEQLAEELIAFCLTDVRVEACRVIVRKLDIYGGRAVPAIEVYRLRVDAKTAGRRHRAQLALRGGPREPFT